MTFWLITLEYLHIGEDTTLKFCAVVYQGFDITSGKRGFYPPPLVPKLFGPGLKVALVPVRAAGARAAPSPGS
jgi:hypothetical protein